MEKGAMLSCEQGSLCDEAVYSILILGSPEKIPEDSIQQVAEMDHYSWMHMLIQNSTDGHAQWTLSLLLHTVKILKFGTPQTVAIIVLKIEKFDVTLH